MNEEQVEAIAGLIPTKRVLWRNGNNDFWQVSGVAILPAYEGDPEPELSCKFTEHRGWVALINCDSNDFVVFDPIFR